MDHYRALIDHLVDLARGCVHADRIRAHGHAERTNDDALPLTEAELARKQALLGLTDAQLTAVALLLEQERAFAIHDVLANLPAFAVQLDGSPLDDLADETPHGDFLARYRGEPLGD